MPHTSFLDGETVFIIPENFNQFFVEIVNLKQPFIDIADLKNQNIVQEIGSSLLQVFCQKATSVPESLFDKLYPADLLKRRLYY